MDHPALGKILNLKVSGDMKYLKEKLSNKDNFTES